MGENKAISYGLLRTSTGNYKVVIKRPFGVSSFLHTISYVYGFKTFEKAAEYIAKKQSKYTKTK